MAKNPNKDRFMPIYFNEWLAAKGITQAKISQESGFSQPKVSKMCRADYNWGREELAVVADILGIKPADLFRNPEDSDSDSELMADIKALPDALKHAIMLIIASVRPTDN